ncbi:hypothetical protein M9H77_28450 [Catharanthus roseus]|uniref:Uncharacterized protein n=1 Tax=Catharanthus roseus TaxID=4058 RepID=A0ACC0AI21_CATRO|nr:hypothetical protein M9H77_28450 [Catharanthus roseus]
MSSHEEKPSSNKEDDDYSSYALQLVFSGALPMVLNAVIKLNVFEIIAKAGPGAKLSPSQIVSQMPTKNPEAPVVLDRMLRMLASYSVLTCSVVDFSHGSGQRVYGLSPVSKYFVKNENGGCFGPLLDLLQDKVLTDIWYELAPAVLEGGTAFNRAYNMHIFKYTGINQKFNETFNTATINHAKVIVQEILKNYKGFENLKTLVDVGGGLGVTLDLITSKYPNLKGINYDLPHVTQNAPTYPGVVHVGGDMFESVPKGDAIFMKWILHDWDDEHCLKLLKNCYKALPENGKVIAVDAILPMNPDNSSSTKHISQVDLFTLVLYHPGGKERTENEFLALVAEAGFGGIRKVCVCCDLWVMEFYK